MTIYDLAAEAEEIIWVPNALSIHYFSKIIADYLLVFLLFFFGMFALFEASFCECFEYCLRCVPIFGLIKH